MGKMIRGYQSWLFRYSNENFLSGGWVNWWGTSWFKGLLREVKKFVNLFADLPAGAISPLKGWVGYACLSQSLIWNGCKDGRTRKIRTITFWKIYRQSSVNIPPIKYTSSNNTRHIFHSFFSLPPTALAIVKIEQFYVKSFIIWCVLHYLLIIATSK